MNKQRAQEVLAAFTGKRILVIGDVMLDEYIWGKVGRISPEAPVMVVDADHHTYVPGGAANVVNNLCALGALASIAGVTGRDSAGTILQQKLIEEGADVTGIIQTSSRPTTQKTRVIAHAQHESQQIVRIDHERRDPIEGDLREQILAYLETAIPECDALLLSDYQKGLLGPEIIKEISNTAQAHGKITTGNLKPQALGGHCRLTMITLNLSEAGAATGFVLDEQTNEGTLRDAGRLLLRKTGAENILITRSARGLTLFTRDGEVCNIPAHRVEVYDGAGAGDSVISTLTLALAAGAAPEEAVRLANGAGAVVVKKVGVATASRDEILETISGE